MTIVKLGAYFRTRILIDGSMRAEAVEVPGRTTDRTDLQAHVSKLTGVHTIAYSIDLLDEANLP